MKTLPKLIENNRQWAADITANDPEFFTKLSKQQTPEYLWIGCSDSRVPPNQITGLMPGEVFVHRNVANLVVADDLNLLSVLQYSVDVLKVRHIVICGHYGCGGVNAAINGGAPKLVDQWISGIRTVLEDNNSELTLLDSEAKFQRLCQLNVIAQAENLSQTKTIQDAWSRGQSVDIHSWIYNLEDGQLETLQEPING